MRPETLIFRGVGSYTEQQTIDFTGKRFIAVVGNTGAGKSTILEAICYALYNRCTWTAANSPLIAEGGDGNLAVEFTFTIDGRRWQVSRSMSRHVATSVHRLTCLDTGTQATGARQVNAEIRRIVGLDCDTFLRAVVLPQGRFQELLQMNDRERGKVLNSLLGLEQLSQIREHARTLQARLKDRLTEYQLHRRRFLDDPVVELAAAAEHHSIRVACLGRLQAARAAVGAAHAEQRQADLVASALTTMQGSLAAAVPTGVNDQLQALLSQAHTLNGQRADIDKLINDRETDQDRIREGLEQAEQFGGDVACTAAAISTLKYLGDQLPQQLKRHRLLTAEAEALALEQVQLDGMYQGLAGQDRAVEEADRAHVAAELALNQIQERQRQAVERLKAWRTATADLEKASTRLIATESELAAAREEASNLTRVAKEAERERNEYEHAQHALMKAHAAAQAAEGLEPGASCPICAHPLPVDFTAPTAVDVTAAEKAYRKTRVRAEKAGQKAAVAAARLATLEHESLPAAQHRVTTAERLLGNALIGLQNAVGDVDLTTPDEQVLTLISSAVVDARQALTDAEEIRDDTRDAATKAKTEFAVLSKSHAERVAAHEQQEREDRTLRQSIAEAASDLPARFTLETPLDVERIEQQMAAAEAHQRHLDTLTRQQADTEQMLADLHSQSAQLDTTYTKKVTKPAAALRDKLLTLTQRIADAAGPLELAAPTAAPAPDTDLDTQAHWAAALLAQAQQSLDRCTAKIAEHQRAGQAAVDAIDLACRTAGAADEADLEQHYLTTHGAVQHLKWQMKRAQAESPVVTALQQRIDTAADTVEVLAQLSTVLAEGKFVADAVSRRVQALLHQASEILSSISGGRYGFASDFQIIDMDTMATRDAKTLSGGETFLASLALALAVVELASRATGHVEALFLDEGFGTLDVTFLRDALITLTDHSTTGRLVTVISHMRSITENAEHVLVVEKSLTTSHAHWADAEERETIINDDLGRGLLE